MVFDEPSHHGINNGRVSKLFIRENDKRGKIVFEWDRDGSKPVPSKFKKLVSGLEKLKES